jgi:2'-5' RNA ligase
VSAREVSRRLFFALWPAAEQQALLGAVARSFLQTGVGRAVPDRSLHITLAFLGSVPESRLTELTPIAHRLAASGLVSPPLQLSFEYLEHWKKAQLLCAVPASQRGVQGANVLAAALKTDLVAAGFVPDLKPFRPHVTVARKVVRSSRPPTMSPVVWDFEDFALLESRTEPTGSVYRIVESFPLLRQR